MPIFKNRGNNNQRAASIIKSMQESNSSENVNNEVDTDKEVITDQPAQENEQQQNEDTQIVSDDNNTQDQSQEVDESASVQNDDLDTVENSDVEATSGTSESDFLSKVSEMLGKEVNSIEDLKPQETEIDPEVKQLLEWKEKTGLSLSQWADYNKDFSKVSDLDVAREILSQDYPNLNEEELSFVLKDYIYDEINDDDSDKFKKSIALKKLAQEGRKTLKEKQLNLIEAQKSNSLTEEQQNLINLAKQVQANKEEVQNAQKTYNDNLNKAALGLKALNLKLSDDLTIEHKIVDSDKKTLPEMVSKMPHWYNEDGSFNHNNIVLDAYKIKNFDNLIKAAFEQGQSVGTEDKIKIDRNINLDVPQTPQGGGDDTPKSNIDQVVAKITGKNRSKLRFRKKK